jgi:hypothetical protein
VRADLKLHHPSQVHRTESAFGARASGATAHRTTRQNDGATARIDRYQTARRRSVAVDRQHLEPAQLDELRQAT